jgi:hypothetical protein
MISEGQLEDAVVGSLPRTSKGPVRIPHRAPRHVVVSIKSDPHDTSHVYLALSDENLDEP